VVVAEEGSVAALIAAYREGLGLAALILVIGESGARLIHSAEETPLAPAEGVYGRWWCKSAEQAEWLTAAAARAPKRNDANGAA
jgi:hypothetical protein